MIKKHTCSFFVSVFFVFIGQLYAQQKFPVTVGTTLNSPYSPYLSDYISPGSNALKFSLVFNDFKEPSWQVRLRIKIESIDLKLETRPEFRPSPITLTPGVAINLTGADLADYFDFRNLSVLGSASALFLQNGRFAEGNYTFCVEALDYLTGVVLSNVSCASAWIRLNDPPRVISPSCDAFVDPTLPLNIPFQWQLFNAASPNATLGNEYKLVIYEMTDPYANPFTAIANGKVLQIFESEALTQTSFIYGLSSPALDIGKTYIYQISARDAGGKDLFKNNGLSEVCWFRYGYPENGKIKVVAPLADKFFQKKEPLYFRWSAPDLRIKNQPFIYELKIVIINESQTPDQAMETNEPWHTERTAENTFINGTDLVVRKALKPGLEYAWQITCFSGRQTVAKSEIQKFTGPPLIDQFYAGNHLVTVIKANNQDSLSFSGVGKFRMGEKDSIEVAFEKLELRRIVSYWTLEKGELVQELQHAPPIIIEPRKAENGNATFYPRAVKLNKDELALEGEVQWPLPHVTKSGNPGIIKSERCWLSYNRFKLLGAAKLSSKNQFDLLDPMDFTLQLSPKSDFLISDNKFELRAEGSIQMPGKVKGKQTGKVNVPFPRTGQLFFFDSLSVENSDIAPVGNTRIYLHPTLACIDLSEGKSPGHKSAESQWKGLYIYDYDVQYNSFTDKLAQLKFKHDLVNHYSGGGTNPLIDASGLTFHLSKDFENDTIQFNSFTGHINHFELTIDGNKISNSSISGEILLPVFSTSDLHSFLIPVTEDGLQAGYMDNLENRSFYFNKGAGEQEILLTVKRGVFEDHRLLNVSLQIEWPALGVTIGSVNNFKIWNDYKIGFGMPNGTVALDTQVEGSLNGFPVTVDAISAGSNKGCYSLAISGKMHLGDDVSGDKGPPSVNAFSVTKNQHAPEGPPFSPTQNQQLTPTQVKEIQEEFSSVNNSVGQTMDAASQEVRDKARESLFNLTSRQTVQLTLDDATKGFSASATDASDPISSPREGGLLAKLNPKQREFVKEVVSGVVTGLTKSMTDSINHLAEKINTRIKKEVNEVVGVINRQVEDKVNSLVFSVAQGIINTTKNPKVDLSSQIEELANVVAASVTKEVKTSVQQSVDKNIITKFTTLVQVQIADRINKYIRDASVQIIIGSLEGRIKLEEIPQTLLTGADTVLSKIGEKIVDQINFSSISDMIQNTATDVLKGVDTDKIVREMEAGAKSVAATALADEGNKIVAKAASDFLNSQLGVDVPINFTGLAKRLVKGEKLFSLDSININVSSKVLELHGFAYLKKDHALYGNVWIGDMDILIKHPRPISIQATYLNGRTAEGLSYWFAQVSPSDGKSYMPGDVMPKKARALSSPVNIGVANIMAIAGRVYKHMKDTDSRPILPDATNEYGAYLNMILFDNSGGESMRLEVTGEYTMAADKNYVITFDGNVQMMNKAPQIFAIDPAAAVKGSVHLMYNSAEKHFLGYGQVEVTKPGQLCAKGSVLVDTSPGRWRVEIGSRDNRIVFIPGCAGWSPTGWLAVTQNDAELGVGLQFSLYADTPTYKYLLVKANLALNAGVAAGVVAAVQYKPDFALTKAGLWADVWADVLINYKRVGGEWKSVSILSVYARGDLTVYFKPSPTSLEGSLKGSVRLLSIVTIDFETQFKKQLS